MTSNDFTYTIPTIGLYNVQISCPHCESVITTAMNSPEIGYVKVLEAQNARLREALGSLSNEASGLLRVHEFALSMDGGNSNMQVLRIRLEEARAALEGKE